MIEFLLKNKHLIILWHPGTDIIQEKWHYILNCTQIVVLMTTVSKFIKFIVTKIIQQIIYSICNSLQGILHNIN